jgi:hypothetical protein
VSCTEEFCGQRRVLGLKRVFSEPADFETRSGARKDWTVQFVAWKDEVIGFLVEWGEQG